MPSSIEWTDETWNPVFGCTKVSAGCVNCYAERMARRLRGIGRARIARGEDPGRFAYYENVVDKYDWTGVIETQPEVLADPLGWKKPRLVFVCSMSDLFHELVDERFIARVFAVMALAPQHTYQVLTKRPRRAADLLNSGKFRRELANAFYANRVEWKQGPWVYDWPMKNVWFGVTVEGNNHIQRAEILANEIPAVVRYVSYEPALHRLDLSDLLKERWVDPIANDFSKIERGIDWVICGGETGPGARALHPGYAQEMRDQCAEAGVPFFFKQWGEWWPANQGCGSFLEDLPRRPEMHVVGGTFLDDVAMFRVGKDAAGRVLDGREWNEYPMEVEQCQ